MSVLRVFVWSAACVLMMHHPLAAQFSLVKNGRSDAVIVVQKGSDSLTKHAAHELQRYLLKISGAHLQIKEHADKPGAVVVHIGKSYLTENQLARLEADSMDEAFMILVNRQGVWLAGKEPVGDLYAVYTLLEEFLGCMKFNAEEEYVPDHKSITLPYTDRLWSPAFSFRIPAFNERWDRDYCHWHKVNSFADWGRWWVHSFHRLVPPEVYYDEHPEYFALVDGRRLQDGQLCLGNPEVIGLLKNNLAQEIALNPTATYWSVSQNDCYNYCECELCKKMYDEYDSYSGAYIYMANELARAFPDKQISTLAYQFTREAPTALIPLPNVNIMFCSIECNRSMPLDQDPRSAGFVEDMKAWAALTNNIFVWDYVVQFRNYLTPFPNFHVLQPNVRFFREHCGRMMFQQGSGRSWSDLSDLKQYLIAKLLWNPDLNADSVINLFIHNYYGTAAPYIRAYFDLMHQGLQDVADHQRLDIYGFPVMYNKAHLTPYHLSRYDALMDSALMAVKGDAVKELRVQRARIPVDFAILDLALNTSMSQWPLMVDGNPNPEILQRIDLFVERCEQTQVTAINERRLIPEAYRDYALGVIHRLAKPNKLDAAKVDIRSEYSQKYPVGGEKALNDRLLGGLSYHYNWLGFEGEDMVVEAVFSKSTSISAVSMNFMHAVESWIFLPVELMVEVSADGHHFTKVAGTSIDNTDRNYLDRSVPFRLEFEDQEVKVIRVVAGNMKTCPEWHRGFGKPSWIFVDEMIIE
jgi:hypothetical protein